MGDQTLTHSGAIAAPTTPIRTRRIRSVPLESDVAPDHDRYVHRVSLLSGNRTDDSGPDRRGIALELALPRCG